MHKAEQGRKPDLVRNIGKGWKNGSDWHPAAGTSKGVPQAP